MIRRFDDETDAMLARRVAKANKVQIPRAVEKYRSQLLRDVGRLLKECERLLVRVCEDGSIEYVSWVTEADGQWRVSYLVQSGLRSEQRWCMYLERHTPPCIRKSRTLLYCENEDRDGGLTFRVGNGAVSTYRQHEFRGDDFVEYQGLLISRSSLDIEPLTAQGAERLAAVRAAGAVRVPPEPIPRIMAVKIKDIMPRLLGGYYNIYVAYLRLDRAGLSWKRDQAPISLRMPNPVWTIHGKHLSYIKADGSWGATHIDTLEPMDPIPYQLNRKLERVPIAGQVEIWEWEGEMFYDVDGGRY